MEGCVLLGDVVRSREVEDRESFGERLNTVLESVSDRYAGDLRTGVELLKGVDELGAVLETGAVAYPLVRDVLDELRPHVVRFALVSGRIDIGEDQGRVAAMDGPAFHRATDLLDAVERDRLWFDMELTGEAVDRAVADEVNLLLRLRHEMTDRQFEIVRAYERAGTQGGAATAVGVSQQAVSDALHRSGWRLGGTIEARLERTLDEVAR